MRNEDPMTDTLHAAETATLREGAPAFQPGAAAEPARFEESPAVTLAVLDMAGTTVADDGVVEQAFADAYAATPVMRAFGDESAVRARARETMGQSKIVVFRG